MFWLDNIAFSNQGKRIINEIGSNLGFMEKNQVFNRFADKRLKRAEKSLAYDKRILENLMEKYTHVDRQKEKQKARFNKGLKKLEDQKETIIECLNNHKGDENKLRGKWENKVREMGQLEGLHQEKIRVLDEKERTLNKRKEQILNLIDQNKTDVTRWRKELEETAFYEIDTEMDHIMANFKILLENSLLYAIEKFFGDKIGMSQLTNQFLNHYGDLQILDNGKIFRFRLNKFDGMKLMKNARKACKIFNDMKIRTADGIRLEMVVKR